MNNKVLRQLKESYHNITPVEDVDQAWLTLARKLPDQDMPMRHPTTRFRHYYLYAVVALVFLSVSTFGVVHAAQTSRPGETLYPVKVLSDQVISKVLGNPELQIERRADEIIDESATTSGELDKAVKEYNKALDNAATGAQKDDRQNKDDLKESLEQQTEKFKKAHPENPQVKEIIEEVIDKTNETNSQIHGVSTSAKEEHPNNASDNSNNGNGTENQNPRATENSNKPTKE